MHHWLAAELKCLDVGLPFYHSKTASEFPLENNPHLLVDGGQFWSLLHNRDNAGRELFHQSVRARGGFYPHICVRCGAFTRDKHIYSSNCRSLRLTNLLNLQTKGSQRSHYWFPPQVSCFTQERKSGKQQVRHDKNTTNNPNDQTDNVIRLTLGLDKPGKSVLKYTVTSTDTFTDTTKLESRQAGVKVRVWNFNYLRKNLAVLWEWNLHFTRKT